MNKTHTNLPVGTEVYYTGDMANLPGTGRIVEVRIDKRFGNDYKIVLDAEIDEDPEFTIPERTFYTPPVSFRAGPGTRFHVLADYQAKRARDWAEYVERNTQKDAV